MNKRSNKSGVIILSHGSRLKKANKDLDKVVKDVKSKTGLKMVMPAYLQFCQPDLTKSIKNLVLKGCRKIIIMPFFLFNGNHVTKDIPAIIKEERVKSPDVDFVLKKSLSRDERLSDIVSEIILS